MISETVRQSWEAPGGNLLVQLGESVLPEIAERAYEAYKSLPRRGVEIGGVLLGRFENTTDGRLEVVVEGYEPVDCEHRWGPSYIYSEADMARLMAVIERWEQPDSLLQVVGYYRSHTRPGIRLEETDLELLDKCFPYPRAVALIVRPGPLREATAALFPHNGDGWRAADGSEPRLRVTLPPVNGVAPATINEPPRQVAPAANGAVPAAHSRAQVPLDSAEPYGEARALQPAITPFVPQSRGFQGTRGWLGRAALAAGLLIAVALLLAGYRLATQRSTVVYVSGTDSLGLTVSVDAAAARVGWSRSRVGALGVTHGRLVITDNGAQRVLELDAEQVREGSVVFVPRGDDVVFRLQLYAGAAGVASESVRLVGNGGVSAAGAAQTELRNPPATAATPQPLAQQHAAAGPGGGQAAEPAPAGSQAESEVRPPPRPAEIPRRSAAPQPVSLSEAPPEVAREGLRLPALPAVPVALPRPEPAAASPPSSPPPPPPSSRAATPSVASYVLPKPRSSPRPVVPDSVRRSILSEVLIGFHLEIDASGRITRITPAAAYGGTTRYLATLAESAVRNWVFTPAIHNGKAVPSEYEVQFRFVK